jgi:CHASE3 domain sensor protein
LWWPVIEHSTLEGWALRLKKASKKDALSAALHETSERRIRTMTDTIRKVVREMKDAIEEDKISPAGRPK